MTFDQQPKSLNTQFTFAVPGGNSVLGFSNRLRPGQDVNVLRLKAKGEFDEQGARGKVKATFADNDHMAGKITVKIKGTPGKTIFEFSAVRAAT